MTTIMFLGASSMQLPPILYAKKCGYRIITVDYKPQNPGHQLATRSYDCSTTDMDGVLSIAKREGIDGVVAYASDPAAPTAAYVGNRLGLPSNKYESVITLVEKDKFRVFLEKNGFNTPKSKSFTDMHMAKDYANELKSPFFIKPVDSSGSKGVSYLTDISNFPSAFEHALIYSRSKRIIIESALIRDSYQIAGDGFVQNGKLSFKCWANEHFDYDCNGLVPIGESFPTVLSSNLQQFAHSESQRILDLLQIKFGALNFDFIYTKNKELYFLEIGPRNGGNLIPEVIKRATGVDLIAATVEEALGNSYPIPGSIHVNGFWASYIVHSIKEGIFGHINISDRIKSKIIQQDIWVTKGEKIDAFKGSNSSLGTMILKFANKEEMCQLMDNMNTDIQVKLQ